MNIVCYSTFEFLNRIFEIAYLITVVYVSTTNNISVVRPAKMNPCAQPPM